MISVAQYADANELSQLVNSAYRGDGSRIGWTTEADLLDGTRITTSAIEEVFSFPNTKILKYEQDGKIMGCVQLERHENRLYLGMLTVQPALQGAGLGKQLLMASENVARQEGCKSVYMTVISVRAELIAWYNRHGYADTGKRKPFVVHDISFGSPKKTLEFVILEKPIQPT